jgi:hypothetical protein
MARSKLLTPAMERVLRAMAEPDEYLIGDGGEWWVGDLRTSGATVNRLLQLCLITGPDTTGGSQIYLLGQDGRDILADPGFQPRIFAALKEHDKDSRTAELHFTSRPTLL